MNMRKHPQRLAAPGKAILLAASISSCGREVDVDVGDGTSGHYTLPPTTGAETSFGGALMMAPGGGSADASGGGTGSDGAAAPPALSLLAAEVVDDGLNVVRVPAVGDDRVSLLQYTNAGRAVTRHADWSGNVSTWHEADGAYHIYTAAAGRRHLGLVYAGSTYGIHADGSAAELSSTPRTYKEFLATNQDGFAWVDFETASSLGVIVFQTWSGARRALTDGSRYRAQIELSRDHIAYVEYADAAVGFGQVFVQPLAGGDAVAVSPRARHQDRPAVDGEWVVWEEYVAAGDSVIRAYDMTTGEARDLSAQRGFRGGADVRDGRVIWEELTGADGDIRVASVTGEGDWTLVGGSGHSAAARLTSTGVVWIETGDGQISLMHARWGQ